MPEVLREGRFTVYVLLPPREHPPAHVHVEVSGVDGEVLVRLSVGDVPATAQEIRGDVTQRDAWRAEKLVRQHDAALWAAWEEYHGKQTRPAGSASARRRGRQRRHGR